MNRATFGILNIPAHRDGDYLATLVQWGALPDVVPVPNASRLLSALCKQNPGAVLKVVRDAVIEGGIPWCGLSHSGEWLPGMMRLLHPLVEKPRISKKSDANYASFAYATTGAVHWDAIGIRPADAVDLLRRRGRKIPDELLELYPAKVGAGETAIADTAAPVTVRKQRAAIPKRGGDSLTVAMIVGYDWLEKAHKRPPTCRALFDWLKDNDETGAVIDSKDDALIIRLGSGEKEVPYSAFVDRFSRLPQRKTTR